MLVLSTAHLRRATAEAMNAPGTAEWIFDEIQYGYLVKVTQERVPEMGIPDELWGCMEFAKSNGCSHIRFDCDGATYESLPKFNW